MTAFSLFLIGCVALKNDRRVSRENGLEIVIQEKTPLLPHGTGDEVLYITGHSFHNLYSAGYVFIPEWNSIIFLTHRDGGAYILHIFSLEKRQDTAIRQHDSLVGLGLGHPKSAFDSSYVEKIEGDNAILIDKSYGGLGITIEDTYQLNRSNKTLILIQTQKLKRD